MLKFLKWLPTVCVGFCVSCSHPSVVQSPNPKPDEATEKRLAEIASSLPIDEPLRHSMQDGFRGSGIHYPWMDGMKLAGIKEVLLEVKGTWYMIGGFRPDKVVRVVYRTEYSRPNSQIVDEQRLQTLQKSALQRQLETVAISKSRQAIWMRIDLNPLWRSGHARVCLTDDEWMPCGFGFLRIEKPLFFPLPVEYPLDDAASYPDLLSTSGLLATRQFSQADLNLALFGASENFSDNTKMIEMLVKAGANVNARRRNDGSTVLMEAVSSLHVTHVKLLLKLGADPTLENQRGETALSWIEKTISSQKDSDPPLPDYVPEIVRLLKQTIAVTSPD